MMFVCYSLAVGILAFGYQRPDEFLLAVMLVAAIISSRSGR